MKACVISGGSYDRAFMLEHLQDPGQRARHDALYKVREWGELDRIIRASTLEGLAPKIGCPLFVVHGTRDFVPLEHSKRLVAEASGPSELLVLEGGRHCSTNLAYRWRPLAGDFMARYLTTRLS